MEKISVEVEAHCGFLRDRFLFMIMGISTDDEVKNIFTKEVHVKRLIEYMKLPYDTTFKIVNIHRASDGLLEYNEFMPFTKIILAIGDDILLVNKRFSLTDFNNRQVQQIHVFGTIGNMMRSKFEQNSDLMKNISIDIGYLVNNENRISISEDNKTDLTEIINNFNDNDIVIVFHDPNITNMIDMLGIVHKNTCMKIYSYYYNSNLDKVFSVNVSNVLEISEMYVTVNNLNGLNPNIPNK